MRLKRAGSRSAVDHLEDVALRAILDLKISGHSVREIAAQMGMSPTAVYALSGGSNRPGRKSIAIPSERNRKLSRIFAARGTLRHISVNI